MSVDRPSGEKGDQSTNTARPSIFQCSTRSIDMAWPLGARAILQGLASASVRVVVRCPADNPTAAPVLNQVLCAPAEVWRAASGLAPVERDMPLPCCPRSRLGPSEAGDARQRQLYVCDGVVGIA